MEGIKAIGKTLAEIADGPHSFYVRLYINADVGKKQHSVARDTSKTCIFPGRV